MSRPAAYAPCQGYRYQILCRHPQHARTYEHCDYAADTTERNHLLANYRLAYGTGWEFKIILLPRSYWTRDDDRETIAEGDSRYYRTGRDV